MVVPPSDQEAGKGLPPCPRAPFSKTDPSPDWFHKALGWKSQKWHLIQSCHCTGEGTGGPPGALHILSRSCSGPPLPEQKPTPGASEMHRETNYSPIVPRSQAALKLHAVPGDQAPMFAAFFRDFCPSALQSQ